MFNRYSTLNLKKTTIFSRRYLRNIPTTRAGMFGYTDVYEGVLVSS